jgi:hypothetical protein
MTVLDGLSVLKACMDSTVSAKRQRTTGNPEAAQKIPALFQTFGTVGIQSRGDQFHLKVNAEQNVSFSAIKGGRRISRLLYTTVRCKHS